MKFVLKLVSIFLIISCKEAPNETPNNVIVQEDETSIIEEVLEKQAMQEASGFRMNDLLGHYTDENKHITIHIDSIINTKIYGKSHIDQLKSNFSGDIDLDLFKARTTLNKSKNTLNFTIINKGTKLKGLYKSEKDSIVLELHKH